jgi:hypothetical protein
MSTVFFVLFFGFIAWRIITSVMGPGIDETAPPRKPQAGASPARRPEVGRPEAGKAQDRGIRRLPQPTLRKQPAISTPSSPTSLHWYIVLDVPADASRREILEAVKRRLEVAEISGDTQAPARIARAAAAGMKLRPGTTLTRGRPQ